MFCKTRKNQCVWQRRVPFLFLRGSLFGNVEGLNYSRRRKNSPRSQNFILLSKSQHCHCSEHLHVSSSPTGQQICAHIYLSLRPGLASYCPLWAVWSCFLYSLWDLALLVMMNLFGVSASFLHGLFLYLCTFNPLLSTKIPLWRMHSLLLCTLCFRKE